MKTRPTAPAVQFLTATGQSSKGMYETFKRFADQILFSARNTDPYLQSHPMPTDRVAALEGVARQSPYWDKKDLPELQARHDMMRAKLYGFVERPDVVARRYPLTDQSLPARYARAISAYRHSDLRAAVAQIEQLIAAQPNNPYFHELKGQALVENGRAAEAIAPLRRAVSLAPQPALIQIMLGQALVATGDPAACRRSHHHAAQRARARAGSRRRLRPARHGLWPQGRSRRRPISPPRRPPSCAATSKPRANSPRAPRRNSRSARPAG